MNKNSKDTIIAVLVVLVIGALVFWVYNHGKDRSRQNLAKQIAALSSKGGPPETIEGLKDAIALYEVQIEQNVKDGAQIGVYWKILATRYADRGMHRDALTALEQALHYSPEDPVLFYLTGESASIVAASVLDFSIHSESEKEHFQSLAESGYLKAIQLDGNYARPLLGLGILYTFDLNLPKEAIPHMERYAQLMPNDTKGMFVLARAYYMAENFEGAVGQYDRILSISKDPKVRSEAQNNKDIIRNFMYE